jgi:hypothetical protein
MTNALAKLQVSINPWNDSDPREIAELTAQLREQISALRVHSVDLPENGESPAGAKGLGDPLTLGIVFVTAVTSKRFLDSLCSMLQAWLSARGARGVKVTMGDDTLELTGVASREQQAITQAWIDRHSKE